MSGHDWSHHWRSFVPVLMCILWLTGAFESTAARRPSSRKAREEGRWPHVHHRHLCRVRRLRLNILACSAQLVIVSNQKRVRVQQFCDIFDHRAPRTQPPP